MHHLDEDRLDEKLEKLESLKSWGPRVVAKFEALLQSEDDFDVFRINPIRYANERRMDHGEAIDLFLHATNIGLLEMHWNMVCSSCASVYGSFEHLQSVVSQFNCPVCKNANVTSLDDLIHVTFGIVPTIRDNEFNHPESLSAEDYYYKYHLVEGAIYPPDTYFQDALKMFATHIEYINPGEEKVYKFDLEPGMLIVRNVESESAAMVAIDPVNGRSVDSIALTFEEKSLSSEDAALQPGVIEFGELKFNADIAGSINTGPLELSVSNAAGTRGSLLIIVMPPIEPKQLLFDPFLSGKKLLSHQTFRDLYRTETIGASEGIAVKDSTIMFTDLTDSTALYDLVGDPQAFFLVQQHFAQLKEVIVSHNGAIVKTIGDAVMATYASPFDAVRASIEMIEVIDTFNQSISENVVIKIGIHRGYCIAVNSNDQQDYFGQTVNTAARVQGLAGPKQIVVSQQVFEYEGVSELIDHQYVVEEREEKVKGIEKSLHVFGISRRSQTV